MSRHALAAGLATVAVALTAAVAGDELAAAKKRGPAASKPALRAFDSCGQIVRYSKRRARRGRGAIPPRTFAFPEPGFAFTAPPPPAPPGTTTGSPGAAPPSGGSPGAAPAPAPGGSPTRGGAEGDATSPTNVQEPGVDEPDLVKARGSRIFAAAGDALHAVETDGTPRLSDSLRLEGFDHELLLSGDRLMVVSDAYSSEEPSSQRSSSFVGPFGRPVTILTEVDVSDPAAMRVVRVERIGGAYVSARLTGSTARVIVSSVARGLDQPSLRSRLRGWVPRSTLASRPTGKSRTRRLSKCGSVRRASTYSGLDMLTVLTIDMKKGLPAVDADALMTGAEIVYASPRRLYVATQRWTPEPNGPQDRPPDTRTAIHSFDTSDPARTTYTGSGEVPGHLLNQFALSERDGVLRAASTETPAWWGGAPQRESESFVSTLENRGGRLVGLGRVGGLGRGERIYAVRFIDDIGYVVTFRQTDPLYTVDLSRPATPRVRGELKIAGYSAYLHPLGGDLLLGVGQDATEEGRTLGATVSLFDVSDPGRPRRLHQRTVGANSSSAVEYDHRAFLWWAPAKLAVLPVQTYSYPEAPFVGAVGLSVDRAAGIGEAGRASHEQGGYSAYITRAFVVRGRLFTLSAAGLEVNDLRTLAEQGRVAFPQPSGPPGG